MNIVKTALITLFALGILGATGMAFMTYHSTQALQGCMELAKGTATTTGTSNDGQWTVVQPQINESILQACIAKKGL